MMPGKILGEILSNDEITKSGLVLATTIKETPEKALVLKVGPPKRNKKGRLIEPCAKPGEIVYFKRNFGSKLKTETKHYIFLKNEEITGVDNEI